MFNPKFKIGDSLYCASFEMERIYVVCPDCGGTKTLRCILFDGTEYTIDCRGCASGYMPPTGRVVIHERKPKVDLGIIFGIEINDGTEEPIEYRIKLGGSYARTLKENELFETKEAAYDRALELAKEYTLEEQERINKKEKDHRSWAWHVHYHRRQIRDAEKTIARATDQLNAAKRHVKEEV